MPEGLAGTDIEDSQCRVGATEVDRRFRSCAVLSIRPSKVMYG